MDDATTVLENGINVTDVIQRGLDEGVEFFQYEGELYAKGNSPIGNDCVLPVIDWVVGDWSDSAPV